MGSFMAVEVRNRLNAEVAFEPPLPVTVLFDCSTLEALATKIEARLSSADELDIGSNHRLPGFESVPTVENDAAVLPTQGVAYTSDHYQSARKAVNDETSSLHREA